MTHWRIPEKLGAEGENAKRESLRQKDSEYLLQKSFMLIFVIIMYLSEEFSSDFFMLIKLQMFNKI